MKLILTLVLAFSLVSLGCEKKQTDVKEQPTNEKTEEAHDDHNDDHAHAQKGYEPGSHEDWCGEHQVQESMCTRCNKSLIAGFKATGDWCDKHQLPNSQCLACNPDLKIERPPKK